MLKRKFYSLRMLLAKLGLRGLLVYLWNRYVVRRSQSTITGTDIIRAYDFLRLNPFGEARAATSRSINWVIPDVGIGGGGHLNIFRVILQLERCGYDCRVVIVGHTHFNSGNEARALIRQHFFPINAEVSIGESSLKPAAITVATSWITAYSVRNFQGSAIKCYFIQDYEPYFYPHGSEYAMAQETYNFGFIGITAGNWLAEKISRQHGMQCYPISFSYDRELYRPLPRRRPQNRVVFFYARSVTPRRGFELGMLVLAEVFRRLPDVQFILAGWDASNYVIPFPHLNAGNVPVKELPDLYSQCDAALVLSFTNLSLLPLELMACGCPVVSNSGPHVEWLLNDNVAVLARPTVEMLSDALVQVLEDAPFRQKLVQNAFDFVGNTDWGREAGKVTKIFDDLIPAESTRGGVL